MITRAILAALLLVSTLAQAAYFPSNKLAQRHNDFDGYFASPYFAFNAPFASYGLIPNTTIVEPALFPAATTITWNYPTSSCSGVCGVLETGYGNYACGPTGGVVPQQVNTITTLSGSHNVTFNSATPDGYDLIYDFFLTNASGGCSTQVFEIEVFAHSPSFSVGYINGVTQIGTTTISGVSWQVAVDTAPTAHDFLFMPVNRADLLSTTIDLKAVLAYLKGQSQITGAEWFNGLALGVEPRDHSGTMRVNSFSVTYN